MKRVLLNFRGGFAGLREGFEALGCEVIENQWMPAPALLDGAALCVADFVDCARRVRRTLRLRKRLARCGVAFVALNRDAPFNRGIHAARIAVVAWLKPFDAYASHSMQAAAKFSAKTLYCPNAARESLYHANERQLEAMRDPGSYRWDVSFFGNLNAARYREHARRVEFLYTLKGRLETENLKVLFRDSEGLSELEQQEIVRTSRINLSTFAACDAGGEASWGLPERCYGVPACGGFLLGDRRRHAPEDFADDERAEYEGLDDCIAKIRHYLAHFAEARAIAERARARVAREHGYRNRAARLLDCARHAG